MTVPGSMGEAVSARLESEADEATEAGERRRAAAEAHHATEEAREAAWLALPVAERVRLGVVGTFRGVDPRTLIDNDNDKKETK